jgi:hypothetical protein
MADFLFPETSRRISSSWTAEQIAEADEVVARVCAESHDGKNIKILHFFPFR